MAKSSSWPEVSSLQISYDKNSNPIPTILRNKKKYRIGGWDRKGKV